MFPIMPYSWYYMYANNYYPLYMEQYDDFDDLYSDLDSISTNINVLQPKLTNPAPSTALILRKELSGYPNYGNPSGNADILYTGNQGVWTFPLGAFLSPAFNRFRRIELVVRGALDDHYNVNENRYSMTVNVNGFRQNYNPTPFVHGRPAGQRFDNWKELVINIPRNNVTRNNRVTIRNTSSNLGESDFIAFDWMEMRFYL